MLKNVNFERVQDNRYPTWEVYENGLYIGYIQERETRKGKKAYLAFIAYTEYSKLQHCLLDQHDTLCHAQQEYKVEYVQ